MHVGSSSKEKVLTIKAKSNSSLLKWSPSGSHYMIACDKEARLFDSNGDLGCTFSNHFKIVSICFLADAVAVTGGQDGVIRVWDTISGLQRYELSHHKSRVSALDAIKIPGRLLLASSSSDGSIAVWDLDRQPAPEVVAVADAKLRVTSMCSVDTTRL
ncbi:hypothetical protein BVRB_026830 [Beta vulgaris subsp. vulgaris]|uniref:Uncharacterized protein n=1 Tax=Beta vulgaris subsp. vulgaris TaxID=3555 RepID=A0A0J8AYV3_BETVV|nr:hypothetical protein BVRB_026830 [Beta vulgaris subsp. vulgaris]